MYDFHFFLIYLNRISILLQSIFFANKISISARNLNIWSEKDSLRSERSEATKWTHPSIRFRFKFYILPTWSLSPIHYSILLLLILSIQKHKIRMNMVRIKRSFEFRAKSKWTWTFSVFYMPRKPIFLFHHWKVIFSSSIFIILFHVFKGEKGGRKIVVFFRQRVLREKRNERLIQSHQKSSMIFFYHFPLI